MWEGVLRAGGRNFESQWLSFVASEKARLEEMELHKTELVQTHGGGNQNPERLGFVVHLDARTTAMLA